MNSGKSVTQLHQVNLKLNTLKFKGDNFTNDSESSRPKPNKQPIMRQKS